MRRVVSLVLSLERTVTGLSGLLRNADATRRRYSFSGEPITAISDAAASVAAVVSGGFELLPTFSAPHYRVVLGTYTEEQAQRLIDVLGDARANSHYVRREPRPSDTTSPSPSPPTSTRLTRPAMCGPS